MAFLSINKARGAVSAVVWLYSTFPAAACREQISRVLSARSASDAQMVWAQRGSTKTQAEEQGEDQGQRLATESARQARVRSPTPLGEGSGESGGWPCGEVRPGECAVRVARRGCDDASHAKGQ